MELDQASVVSSAAPCLARTLGLVAGVEPFEIHDLDVSALVG